KDQNSNVKVSRILLEGQIAVNGDKDIKVGLCLGRQVPVIQASPFPGLSSLDVLKSLLPAADQYIHPGEL
ncbi:MAG: hypothetical protein ACREP8_02055, partial [Candidatus Binatia bacterium]